MSELIISVSGLRGIVGEGLTPEVAMRYACAYAVGQGNGPIVVARDGRATGRMLADAVQSALCAIGRDVIDAGLASTPTVGVLVREHRAAGAIQITASHNPAPYNGLKAFSDQGRILTAAAGKLVAERYHAGEIPWVTHDRLGHVIPCADTMSAHAKLVLATIDVDRVRRRRFKVFLDSNRAASGLLAARLATELGCQLTHAEAEPDGLFTRTPEPTAENLAGVCGQVPAVGAEIGLFPDPDGDRLALVDETGCYIGEEYTLALCLDHVLPEHRGAVVTNIATSRMSQDLAGKYGVPFHHAPVGEANVVEAMLAHKAVLGGEGNGGVIDPRVGYVRDSYIAMALVLDVLAARDMKLSQLVSTLPRYHIEKTKTTFDRAKLPRAVEALRKLFPDAKLDNAVGIRFNWPGQWLLLHPSNTEPIVRVIAEAGTADEAKSLTVRASQALAAL